MVHPLQRTVANFLLAHRIRQQGLIVGVSGGADSLALMHSLRAIGAGLGLRLHAAHLNHQLRGRESEQDARFVERLMHDWDVPLTVESHDVGALAKARKLSVEEAARMVRYGFLAQVAEREGAHVVAVGHNADDQVETILMHFLRGAGLAGLRGMQAVSQYPLPPPMALLRPLLEVSRPEIAAYCEENGIAPRDDSTNAERTYFRNRLRLDILPALEELNPNLRNVLRQNARILGDDYAYVMQRSSGAWGRTVLDATPDGVSFSLSGWKALQPALQRGLIREAVARLRPQQRNLGSAHVDQALQVANHGHIGSRASLPEGLWLFRDFDAIVVGERLSAPDLPVAPERSLAVPVPGRTPLARGWVLEAQELPLEEIPSDALRGIDPYEAFLSADVIGDGGLTVRSRAPGDRFLPLGLDGHGKDLRRVMTDLKVPAAWRARTPLVVAGNDVLWIVGWRLSERARIGADTSRILRLRFFKQSEQSHAN